MKVSELLYKAAEYMGSEKGRLGCCDAVFQVNAKQFSAGAAGWLNIFRPSTHTFYWWGYTLDNWPFVKGASHEQAKENQTARVLALLFAAHMAEDAGD